MGETPYHPETHDNVDLSPIAVDDEGGTVAVAATRFGDSYGSANMHRLKALRRRFRRVLKIRQGVLTCIMANQGRCCDKKIENQRKTPAPGDWLGPTSKRRT